MGERKIGLVATIAIAVVVLVSVSIALLVFDARTTGADALRTGGLAAGSVVALYALWLNDRRRRTEEKRQELETQRQELDRERYALEQQRQALEDRRTAQDHVRAADERFARAVELLGNEADQVRVGALHALAGLARNNPDYAQTVLDVLCSYLRRPFDHPKWTGDPVPGKIPEELQRERTVRQTASKLVVSLLPTTDEVDPPRYDLDIAAASMDRFDLSGRVVGRLDAQACRFRHRTNLEGAVFHGKVDLHDATFLHPLQAGKAVFHDRLILTCAKSRAPVGFELAEFHAEVNLQEARFAEHVSFEQAAFFAPCDLRRARFDHGVDLRAKPPIPGVALHNTEVNAAVDNALPEGWELEPLAAPNRARISHQQEEAHA
ncbi:Pentapeptide repeat-containing protein [Saccharopolyspora kobensis]|uniref:Pentapeptide repeat-containing protein n=1 Tax=Saccharopolyspora kobensis TaxID=146035 RepID=A0A1H6E0L3_9PSEU|nr:pentapeptide repeat-containing protein [Saccharopolyspora kobensis]SEG91140.1 Pentapeptide repeat-containing protein [Saccharopolyspora kobensis]SFF13947.1 Pentapeptide repeat-containing protein [Saccharopolyspora kobensis]